MMEEFFTEEKSNKELKEETQINEYEYLLTRLGDIEKRINLLERNISSGKT